MAVVAAPCLCSAALVSAAMGSSESAAWSQREAGWRPPQTVAPLDAATSLGSPQVALGRRGDAVAAWGLLSAPVSGGAVAEHRAGASWTTPRSIPGFPEAVATGDRGDALVAWVEPAGGARRVALSFRRPGGSWRAPSLISPAGEDASAPRVALDARGGALAVWSVRRQATGDYVVKAATRSPRGTWGRAKVISVGTSAELAMAGNGQALVVWSQPCDSVASESQCAGGGPSSVIVRAAARSAQGRWTRPRTLSALGEDARLPRVQVNGSGTAVVVWETFSIIGTGPPSRGVKAAVGSTGGRFGTPQSLFGAAVDSSARVALAPTGDAVAVWSSSDRVHAAIRRPRGRFGTSVLLGSGFEPEVGTDARGAAIVVWTRSDGADLFVQAARRAVGGAFGPGIDLAPIGRDCTRHRGCASEVTVAVGSSGRAVAAWLVHVTAGQVRGGSYLQAAEYATGRTRDRSAACVHRDDQFDCRSALSSSNDSA